MVEQKNESKRGFKRVMTFELRVHESVQESVRDSAREVAVKRKKDDSHSTNGKKDLSFPCS